jgi:hypothetical protein
MITVVQYLTAPRYAFTESYTLTREMAHEWARMTGEYGVKSDCFMFILGPFPWLECE